MFYSKINGYFPYIFHQKITFFTMVSLLLIFPLLDYLGAYLLLYIFPVANCIMSLVCLFALKDIKDVNGLTMTLYLLPQLIIANAFTSVIGYYHLIIVIVFSFLTFQLYAFGKENKKLIAISCFFSLTMVALCHVVSPNIYLWLHPVVFYSIFIAWLLERINVFHNEYLHKTFSTILLCMLPFLIIGPLYLLYHYDSVFFIIGIAIIVDLSISFTQASSVPVLPEKKSQLTPTVCNYQKQTQQKTWSNLDLDILLGQLETAYIKKNNANAWKKITKIISPALDNYHKHDDSSYIKHLFSTTNKVIEQTSCDLQEFQKPFIELVKQHRLILQQRLPFNSLVHMYTILQKIDSPSWQPYVKLLTQQLKVTSNTSFVGWYRTVDIEIDDNDFVTNRLKDAPSADLPRPLALKFYFSKQKNVKVINAEAYTSCWIKTNRSLVYNCDNEYTKFSISYHGLITQNKPGFFRYKNLWGSKKIPYEIKISLPKNCILHNVNITPLTQEKVDFTTIKTPQGNVQVHILPVKKNNVAQPWLAKITVDYEKCSE
ncbi:hypothetical protein [Candidatus Uabimicrobium amorphum]|uniref:Uncharacterized protein n=1 Tax=Uabimicrobium amorphum TaxID=2596890 RepID=A0A5S9ILZ2_UABAM|nr:hypothetical protein [Candidatus Uabimicrobium amorphum]BBM83876.1 hypothetical protein UABAM_02231 [Candidatus Uabimicrobium amorphum]